MKLSQRISLIKPSATLAVTSKVLEMKAAGLDVLGFGAGELDFPTWPNAQEAAHASIRRGDFYYTSVGGTPELKAAITTKLSRDNHLEYSAGEVMAGAGGKQILYNLMQALLDPGDEVLIPGPYWVSYRDMAVLAGAEPRIVMAREDRGFRLTPDELRGGLSERTRLVLLNSPANPTGAAYDEGELAAIAEVLSEYSGWIVTDDVYEFIRYDEGQPRHLLSLAPRLRERTVIANSVSKTYAMTGWRVGYAAGPAEVISAMSKLQGQSTSNPAAVSQAAAAAALSGDQAPVGAMVAELRGRRDYVCERINAIDGLSVVVPGGAFYVFPNVAGVFERTGCADGDALALAILENARVGLVGGNDFGSPDHVRISYATSMDVLERGLDAIEGWLGSL